MNSQPVPSTRRAAKVLMLCTLCLLLAGGLVTTYRVGMAVNDWPTTFGYSMLTYPLDKMLENSAVGIEHGHRLLATLVGILTLVGLGVTARLGDRSASRLVYLGIALEVALVGVVISTTRVDGAWQYGLFAAVLLALLLSLSSPQERGLRAAAVLAHLAVVFQGLLGGTRVLENSQSLAFLHGSCAQLVFVSTVVFVVLSSDRWRMVTPADRIQGRSPAPLASLAVLVVFGQAVLGAWLRHSGHTVALLLHLLCALIPIAVLLVLFFRMGPPATGLQGQDWEASPLRTLRLPMLVLLCVQVLLGVGALAAILLLSEGFTGPVTVVEGITTTLHVGVGAALLGVTVSSFLWSCKLAPRTAAISSSIQGQEPVPGGQA